MTIKDDKKGGKIITLSKEFDSRAKVLNAIYFFVFTAAFLPMLIRLLSDPSGELLPLLVIIGLSAAYLFAAYKFLNKASQSEKLIASKDTLTIQLTGVFSKQKRIFRVDDICKLTHVDKPVISKHQLAGESLDYLGFQTTQAVINEMHGDKRVSFLYDGRKISFGENVYSWDFDELAVLLYDVTGQDLSRSETAAPLP